MRKSQVTAFLLLLFYIERLIFCQKIYLEKISVYLYSLYIYIYIYIYIVYSLHLHYYFFTWQVIGNAVTPKLIQIFIGVLDAILRSKILGNRLGILTKILIAMDYIFYLYISDKYLQFRKKKHINLGNQFHYKKYNERDQNK